MKISNDPYKSSKITLPWVYIDSYFSNEELDLISFICQEKSLSKSQTVSKKIEQNIDHYSQRVSSNCFVFNSDKTYWFFEKLNNAIEYVNNIFYGFDLYGYESFQYAEYYGYNNGKYDAHMDLIMSEEKPKDLIDTRKLSMSLLLSEPEIDYTGGDFFIHQNINPTKLNLKKGTIVFFPSFMLHGVSPVTSGVRKSIVVWVEGPKFK